MLQFSFRFGEEKALGLVQQISPFGSLSMASIVVDASKLQVHNIVSSNKVISKVSFPWGLDKTSTKIIINLQLFGQSINLRNLIKLELTQSLS